jgi:hypothetical protein
MLYVHCRGKPVTATLLRNGSSDSPVSKGTVCGTYNVDVIASRNKNFSFCNMSRLSMQPTQPSHLYQISLYSEINPDRE